MPCGDDCLNRLILTECSPRVCPVKELCTNQKIRRQEWAEGLKAVDLGDKGMGVVTRKPVREGDFLVEYVGEIVSFDEFHRRMTEVYSGDAHHYCLHLDSGALIDAYRCGNLARLVNHSCAPNCEMQKWSVNGTYRYSHTTYTNELMSSVRKIFDCMKK